MDMRPSVTYTPCTTSSMGQTGNVILFAQFEKGDLLSETRKDAESGNEYDDNSIMPPLLNKEEIDTMDSGDESDDELISTEMLEDICEGSKSHTNVIGEKHVIK